MLVLASLFTLARGSDVPLDFKYDACQAYCEAVNPHSFTFTKYACPEGGPDANQGGFADDECSEGKVREITYPGTCAEYSIDDCKKNAQKNMGCEPGQYFGEEVCLNRRTTTVEEAMLMCGNEKIVTMDDGSIWLSPEYKFRLNAQKCRDGHADGSGWPGDDTSSGPDPDAVGDDVDYQTCLQTAYDDCIASEPLSDSCVNAFETNNQLFWCTFCYDCDNDKDRKACNANREIYTQAAQSCFSDNKKSGYMACLDNARDLYDKEVLEREAVCSETFVLERASLPCTFGFVNCCCMVEGTLIEHPVDSVHTCMDRASVAQCDTWKSHGFCVEGHKYYASMIDNCRSTCGLCTAQVPDVPEPSCGGSSGGSSAGASSCDCFKDVAQVMNGVTDYEQEIIAINDPDKCKNMGGKWKSSKGTCSPAKNPKKIDCEEASDDMESCMALGCDLLWDTNADGSDAGFSCGGNPTAFN